MPPILIPQWGILGRAVRTVRGRSRGRQRVPASARTPFATAASASAETGEGGSAASQVHRYRAATTRRGGADASWIASPSLAEDYLPVLAPVTRGEHARVVRGRQELLAHSF